MGILTCQPQSKFAKAYNEGVNKKMYWESTYEDAIDVCAKVSRVAALVYHNSFGDNKNVPARDASLDYGANYANMLGFKDKSFWELMRLYLVLHA
jgi:citrate synthase